ncbi:hypothetical protein Kpol_1058p47, partial [Vanderwaltozyma polyspora DSM 70294]
MDSEFSLHYSNKVFNDLVETSKNLPNDSSEFESIQLSINEIRKRASELRKDREAKQVNHTKAHYLLAGSGISIEDVDNSIKNLQSKHIIEQHFPNKQLEGELDTYLRLKKDENILSSIEKLLSTASKDFDSFVSQNLNLDWEQHKDEVRENFGILVKRKNMDSNKSGFRSVTPAVPKWGGNNNSILDSSSGFRLNVNENYLLRDKFERYAKIIHAFNNARQVRRDFPLVNEIISMLNSSGDSKNRQIMESWYVLRDICTSKVDDVVIRSRLYLEKQFMEYID